MRGWRSTAACLGVLLAVSGCAVSHAEPAARGTSSAVASASAGDATGETFCVDPRVPGLTASGPAPTPTSPPSGSVFSNYPRTTKVSWGTVPGAAGYRLDVQYASIDGGWVNDLGYDLCGGTWSEQTFDFVGMTQGRWRVRAIYRTGWGPASAWQTFTYTV